MKDIATQVRAFYDDAGKACKGDLHCLKCGEKQPCSPSDAAFFLRYGWPVHCGEQMVLTKRRAA